MHATEQQFIFLLYFSRYLSKLSDDDDDDVDDIQLLLIKPANNTKQYKH